MSDTPPPQTKEMHSFLYHGWVELRMRMRAAAHHLPLLETTLEKGFEDFLKYGLGSAETEERLHTFIKTHALKSEYDQLLRGTLDRLQGDDPDRCRQAGVYFWEGFLKIQHGMHPDDVKKLRDYTEIMKTSLIGYEVPDPLPGYATYPKDPSNETAQRLRHFDYKPGRGRD